MKKIIGSCILTICTFIANGQSKEKTEAFKTFAKAYGYVKYFHPSDEAANIDWNAFAIYGVQQIAHGSSQEELISTLNRLFQPIAPSVKFYNTNVPSEFDLDILRPENLKEYEFTYWQHYGVSVDMIYKNKPYNSVRVNRYEASENANSFGNVISSLSAEKYKGKEFIFRGWVKRKEGSDGTGHLWFRVDNSDKSRGFFDNMANAPITESAWKQYEITGTIDELADKLVFGCLLSGKGTLYMDQLEFLVKEGDEWVNVPLLNSNFETETKLEINESNQWRGVGKDYTMQTVTEEMHEGKQSAMIQSVAIEKTSKAAQLFKHKPAFGELIEKPIGNGISCQIPLVLYATKENTYPLANIADLDSLKMQLSKSPKDPSSAAFRIGNIINVYNVFQHFYPYFDVVAINWEEEFEKAVLRSFEDQTANDHLITLQKFTAPLKDGHISVNSASSEVHVPPISWEWVEGKLVVTEVYEDIAGVNVGDVITKINDQSSEVYFKECTSRISAGTDGWLQYRARELSLRGAKNSELKLVINNKPITLIRTINLFKEGRPSLKKKEAHKMLEEGIYYLNLDLVSMDTINALMPTLENAKAIICDLRGYPKGNHGLISHLLKKRDTHDKWMRIPQIIYPDQERKVQYDNAGWNMPTKKPYLGDKNIVFIIDGSAISYAESYMGFIEGYKLATIIGQPTAGTNGNVNPFTLPGGYRISWTGMRVVKHDGSQHHGVGIIPNIYLNKTIAGVKSGKDEFLEKAIEIAKKGN